MTQTGGSYYTHPAGSFSTSVIDLIDMGLHIFLGHPFWIRSAQIAANWSSEIIFRKDEAHRCPLGVTPTVIFLYQASCKVVPSLPGDLWLFCPVLPSSVILDSAQCLVRGLPYWSVAERSLKDSILRTAVCLDKCTRRIKQNRSHLMVWLELIFAVKSIVIDAGAVIVCAILPQPVARDHLAGGFSARSARDKIPEWKNRLS